VVKKVLSGSVLLLLLAASAASAELKIAVLDTQRALLESEEAKQLLQSAQTDLEKEQNDVNALGAEIMSMQEQMQKDADVMSPSEQRKRQKAFEDKQIEYQFQVNRLQKEVQDRRQELMQLMAPKIDAVLKDLIETEGYDVIMQRGSLLYANSKHDITRRVTEKLNERRGTAGR
jgi:outer membrane protein